MSSVNICDIFREHLLFSYRKGTEILLITNFSMNYNSSNSRNVTNGITEGFVNKLKAIKRLMYGRAGIELLRNKMVMEHLLFN